MPIFASFWSLRSGCVAIGSVVARGGHAQRKCARHGQYHVAIDSDNDSRTHESQWIVCLEHVNNPAPTIVAKGAAHRIGAHGAHRIERARAQEGLDEPCGPARQVESLSTL